MEIYYGQPSEKFKQWCENKYKSGPSPLPYFTYDANKMITGLVEDESINRKFTYLDYEEVEHTAWRLKDENKTFTDEYAMGVGNNVFDNSRYVEGYGEDKSPTTVSLPNATGIGIRAFDSCSNLSSINCPNVSSIGDYAFYYCPELTSINCPNVSSIDSWAFCQCWCISSIDLPNVNSIGYNAFSECSEDLVIDLSENTNFSVANEATYREDWAVPEGATIIFHDSPQ